MRIPAVVRALAVLLTALLAVPFLPPLVGGAEPGASAPAVVPATGDYYLVDLPAEGATGLRDAGLAVVEAYESFALVRDPRGLAASLRETGPGLVPRGAPTRGAGPTEAGVISFAEGDGFGVVRARVPAALLPAITRLRAVEYIEPIYELRLANADTQWVHQSNQSGVRTEWGVGLDGSGQIIGIADTGLDFDNEQFRQNNSAAQGDLDIKLGGDPRPSRS